jgi:hypothetical protein
MCHALEDAPENTLSVPGMGPTDSRLRQGAVLAVFTDPNTSKSRAPIGGQNADSSLLIVRTIIQYSMSGS